jgi:hypothetical protein
MPIDDNVSGLRITSNSFLSGDRREHPERRGGKSKLGATCGKTCRVEDSRAFP